ncbi:TPA: YopX family protein, partial [Listeria monocytogenes]
TDLCFNETEAVGVSGCGNAKCTLCVDWYSFDDVVLMQYTGLKDKNGKKIFEGDVVTAFSNINKYTDSFAGDVEPTFCFTSIVYDGACFKTTYKGEPSYVLNQNGSSLVKHMEVIGNIHENPELLEGTE